MADPRLAGPFNIGVTPEYRTYSIDGVTILYSVAAGVARGSAQVGLAVTFSGNDTVALAADGDMIVGQLDNVEPNSICRVQVEGPMVFASGTAATLTLGLPIVGALLGAAKGYIRAATVGAFNAEQVRARGFITNAADPTAVTVDIT